MPLLKNYKYIQCLKKYPLYFWLLPAYYVFHNYNNLFGFIAFKDLFVFGLIIYLISICFYLLFRIVFRDLIFSAIVSFLIVGYNLFFGALHDFWKSTIHSSLLNSYKIVIPVSITLLIALIVFLRKSKNLVKLTQYLNILLIVLLFVDVLFLIQKVKVYSETKNLIYSGSTLSNQFSVRSVSDTSKPDIYLLVYDEYTNRETLQQLWNYDNSEITDWLHQQGFYIPQKTKANYNFTPFSISSALNMQYLDSATGNYGNSSLRILQAIKSFSDNETVSILKKERYHFRYFVPFENSIEDIGAIKEFGDIPAKHLYNTLLLYRIYKDILWNFPQNKLSTAIRTLFQFNNYANVNKRLGDIHTTILKVKSAVSDHNSPKFVYAHLMITHAPHIFDSLNQIRNNFDMDSANFFKTYPAQVKYANQTIKELVQFIITNSKRKAVIMILGDHGFRNLPASMLEYNFPNFCAISFPDRNYSLLYDSISPVNIFKVVFNTCFNQNFPLSKDSTIAVKYQ